jgi:hypothetical protein
VNAPSLIYETMHNYRRTSYKCQYWLSISSHTSTSLSIKFPIINQIFQESYTFFSYVRMERAVMALVREKEIEKSVSEMDLDAIECGRPWERSAAANVWPRVLVPRGYIPHAIFTSAQGKSM